MKKWLTLLAMTAGLVSTGNAADINRLKTFTGVASQWPWQLNTDGTWTLRQPAVSDLSGFGSGVATSLANPVAGIGSLVSVVYPLGVDLTGSADATTVLQAAINTAASLTGSRGLMSVYLPCGLYKVSSTIQISSSNIMIHGEAPGCVMLQRRTDYGPAVQFSLAGGPISNVGIENVTIDDLSAVTGAAGYSTCATSPYQIVVDGANFVTIKDVYINYGCGGIALRGVFYAFVSNVAITTYQIPGAAGQTGLGTQFYVGYTSNANIGTKYSQVVLITNMDIEGGAPGAFKTYDGIRLDGVDGVWGTNIHVQGGTNADFHLANSSSQPMANIFFSNSMADIATGVGVLMDGTSQVSRAKFEGTISAVSAGGFNQPGFRLTGTGGALGFELSASIDGWGGPCVQINSTAANTKDITIQPKSVRNCNGSAGPFPALDIATGSNITILPGLIGAQGSENKSAPNILIGSSVNHISINGVTSYNSSTYGMTISAGANNISVTGGDFGGNTSGAVLDNSGNVTKSFSGVLNLPWFDYTPTLACGSGSMTTGSAAGRYMISGKTVSFTMTITDTTNGTCGSYLAVSVPFTAAGTASFYGRENAATFKMIGGVLPSGGMTAFVSNYDNTYPGASGATIYLSGVYEAQ